MFDKVLVDLHIQLGPRYTKEEIPSRLFGMPLPLPPPTLGDSIV